MSTMACGESCCSCCYNNIAQEDLSAGSFQKKLDKYKEEIQVLFHSIDEKLSEAKNPLQVNIKEITARIKGQLKEIDEQIYKKTKAILDAPEVKICGFPSSSFYKTVCHTTAVFSGVIGFLSQGLGDFFSQQRSCTDGANSLDGKSWTTFSLYMLGVSAEILQGYLSWKDLILQEEHNKLQKVCDQAQHTSSYAEKKIIQLSNRHKISFFENISPPSSQQNDKSSPHSEGLLRGIEEDFSLSPYSCTREQLSEIDACLRETDSHKDLENYFISDTATEGLRLRPRFKSIDSQFDSSNSDPVIPRLESISEPEELKINDLLEFKNYRASSLELSDLANEDDAV